jgi:hypothetical protein
VWGKELKDDINKGTAVMGRTHGHLGLQRLPVLTVSEVCRTPLQTTDTLSVVWSVYSVRRDDVPHQVKSSTDGEKMFLIKLRAVQGVSRVRCGKQRLSCISCCSAVAAEVAA